MTDEDPNPSADARRQLEECAKKLKAATREVESLSYAVSHDLRAPVRAIQGFSGILTEDYRDKLDDEGKRYIEIIASSASTLNRMIDDLLGLSRLSRAELDIRRVDLSELARDVVAELSGREAGRTISTDIGTMPPAYCDAELMRKAYCHLISNSIKFTRPKSDPRIDIGSLSQEGKTVYYVKDNGVGFDMQYVSKLFDVFQRLHLAEEFEGTGIGLACVQRIVRRHGGEVWADAQVDRGAAFYFTLPTTAESEAH